MSDIRAHEDLRRLQDRTPAEHEARLYYLERVHGRAAVKILPGEFFVSGCDIVLATTLGSCVAVCLHDPTVRVGGLNHFMLPQGEGRASGRFGAFAMSLLMEQLVRHGARSDRLQAKIFGGGQLMASLAGAQVGERNVAFVEDHLRQARIPVVARDVLGATARTIRLFSRTGAVLCKRLSPARVPDLERDESRYGRGMGPGQPEGVVQESGVS